MTAPRNTLPGQIEMPGTGEQIGEMARRLVAAPLKPKVPQMPMDIGLFDDVNQLDLIEMFMD